MRDAGFNELADHVRRVLLTEWDPIGIVVLGGHEDEYDSYVPALVALTRDSTAFEDRIIAHLSRIESEEMCMALTPERRTRAARALLGLRAAYSQETGKLVDQRISADGLRCAWIFETHSGLYVYEEGVLLHEDDENGPWSCWVGASLGRSGLFDTAEAAKRDAHAVIGWLREGEPAVSASVAIPWGQTVGWRALEPRERAVLERLLAADFPGRDGLIAQFQTALVRRIDNEGSLRFRVEGPAAVVAGRVPVEGRYRDGNDASGRGVSLLLHVFEGRLHELDIFKEDGAHIQVGPFEVSLDRIAVSVN